MRTLCVRFRHQTIRVGHNIFRGENVKFRGPLFEKCQIFAEHCVFHYDNKS